jgi:sulfur-oxidizing protein SoxA
MRAHETLLVALCLLPAFAHAEPLRSGSTFLSDNLRARQADDGANPAMLWVDEGRRLWHEKRGLSDRACASCHGATASSMRDVATRYPLVDESGRLLNLEARINVCRTTKQQADALAYESEELLSLTAFIAYQARGLPMRVATGGTAGPYLKRGEAFFNRRQGQLNLSCANCHVDHVGKRLRGDIISHGLGNGYPAYRIEWQSIGSLHRRLRACSFGVRAVRFDYGSQEYLELELYLAARANGVKVETPAIRR